MTGGKGDEEWTNFLGEIFLLARDFVRCVQRVSEITTILKIKKNLEAHQCKDIAWIFEEAVLFLFAMTLCSILTLKWGKPSMS
jgi:hypothetical protein